MFFEPKEKIKLFHLLKAFVTLLVDVVAASMQHFYWLSFVSDLNENMPGFSIITGDGYIAFAAPVLVGSRLREDYISGRRENSATSFWLRPDRLFNFDHYACLIYYFLYLLPKNSYENACYKFCVFSTCMYSDSKLALKKHYKLHRLVSSSISGIVKSRGAEYIRSGNLGS